MKRPLVRIFGQGDCRGLGGWIRPEIGESQPELRRTPEPMSGRSSTFLREGFPIFEDCSCLVRKVESIVHPSAVVCPGWITDSLGGYVMMGKRFGAFEVCLAKG